MGRATSILNKFPAFMRTDHSGKVMADISRVLGDSLDENERQMGDILRSHRLLQARHEIDLHRLAALLGLKAEDFALLRAFYVAEVFGKRNENSYAAYLKVLRALIQRTVNVFTEGCGTIWALLEGTSILLTAENILAADGKPVLEHPDVDIVVDGIYRGGFIHRLAINYKTMDGDTLQEKSGYIYLVENPLQQKTNEAKERRQGERFPVVKSGFFESKVSVKIKGVQDRTVLPQIINITTHQGIGFNGVIRQDQTLLFTADGKAFLDGLDVTERCYYFEGALFDEPNLAGQDDVFVVVEPESALQRKFPRPVIMPLTEIKMPKLPMGDSNWRFTVRAGVFDGDAFNRCVFAFPEDPAELQAQPASGNVQLLWQEHELYAASILIPDDLQALDEFLDKVNLTAWIKTGLERFRAAGIRINVDYYSDDWIIDHSILRDTEALTGSGIFFDGTVI